MLHIPVYLLNSEVSTILTQQCYGNNVISYMLKLITCNALNKITDFFCEHPKNEHFLCFSRRKILLSAMLSSLNPKVASAIAI